MQRICYLGGVAGASILSVASVNDPMIWAWLLVAAEVAVCVLLRKESQRPTKSIPVFSKPRRPIPRAMSPASWR